MWVEHWFKIRKIDWKKWSRYSNMQDEIRSFSRDKKIDRKENDVLNKILNYNKKKNREKLLLKRTTRYKLEWLKNIGWLSLIVKNKINSILNISNFNRNKQDKIKYKERIWSQNKYLWNKWQLRNINNMTLRDLLSQNISKINDLIWNNKNIFSITNRNWKIYNVFLWRKNWKLDYFYKDWVKKNRRVKIYNWYKLWIFNSNINKTIKKTYKPKENIWRNIELNNRDLKDFAAMVKAEAWTESETWKIAVANVILNRMKSWKSMRQVLYKKTRLWKSEFSPVDDWRLKKMKRKLTKLDYDIVRNVLGNKVSNPVGNATFFQNRNIEKKADTWQERAEKKWRLKKIAIIWNHIFRAVV